MLKSVWNQFFFKRQFALNKHNIVRETIRLTFFYDQITQEIIFRGQFWIFVGFLDFFTIKDLVFGFGHRTLSERLF